MNTGIFIAKKNYLISLIRKLGNLVNEDKIFLEEYIQEVLENWKHDYDKAIMCFKDLIQQGEILKWQNARNGKYGLII